MSERFGKTEAGRLEIRDRARNMSRTARNLLLILDDRRSVDEYLSMVHGATPADVKMLLDAGLVTAVSLVVAVPALESQWGRTKAPAPQPTVSPGHAGYASGLSYKELYSSLNELVKDQLGLIKGYKYTLQVERASGVAGLVEVAVRVVDEVRSAKGEHAAQMVSRALALSALVGAE